MQVTWHGSDLLKRLPTGGRVERLGRSWWCVVRYDVFATVPKWCVMFGPVH